MIKELTNYPAFGKGISALRRARMLSPQFATTLLSLSKVFKVKGSLVYRARLEGNQTYIQVIPGFERGAGRKFKSPADKQAVPALDAINRIFRDRGVWAGQKAEGSFSCIWIASRQPAAQKGKIVLLLGEYDETFPKEKKPELLKEKLEEVMRGANSRWSDGSVIKKMDAEFQALSWRFLFENSASDIEKELNRRITHL